MAAVRTTHAPSGYECPFCALATGADADRQQDIVRRTAGAMAFVSPRWWPNNHGHVLVVPDRHYENLYELPAEAGHAVHDLVRDVAIAIRSTYGCEGVSTRQHNEPAGNQDAWHYHVHVFPRYDGDALYGSRPYPEFVTAEQRRPYAEKLRRYFAAVPPVRVLDTVETDRLVLRRSRAGDAVIYHRLWTERDPRVPPHRRINAEGRPTVADVAAQIRAEREEPGPGILAVERKGTGDVIGYCGLSVHGNGSPDEPELAYELLRAAHGCGYATEAGRAVVTWADEAGFRRLWAGVWDWNAASRRVLEKLGFREVGQVEPHSAYGHSLLTVREP